MGENESRSPRRSITRLLAGLALLALVVAASLVAAHKVFPPFKLGPPTNLTQLVTPIAIVTLLVLFGLVRAAGKKYVLGDICWAVVVPLGLALTIFTFWGLLSLRSTLGLRPREAAGSQVASGRAAQPALQAAPSPSPEEKYPAITYLLAVFLDNGWFQPACVSCFWIAVAALILKLRRLRKEHLGGRNTLTELVNWPEGPFTVDSTDELLKNVRETPEIQTLRQTALVRRVERMLERVRNTRSSTGVDELMNSLSAIDADSSSSSFGGVAFLVYLMPAIGFLGTIYGVGQAIFGFSQIIPRATDFLSISPDLTKITYNLGVAFDTTLLGLVLSAVAGLLVTVTRQVEESILGQVDNDSVEMFRSLTHEDPGTKQIVDAIRELGGRRFQDKLDENMRRLQGAIDDFAKKIEDAKGTFAAFRQEVTGCTEQLQKVSDKFAETSKTMIDTTAKVDAHVEALGKKMTETTDRLAADLSSRFGAVCTDVKNSAESLGKNLAQSLATVSTSVQNRIDAGFQKTASELEKQTRSASELAEAIEKASKSLDISGSRINELDAQLAALKELPAIRESLEDVRKNRLRVQLEWPSGYDSKAPVSTGQVVPPDGERPGFFGRLFQRKRR